MGNKLRAALLSATLAAATLAPSLAEARDHHGGWRDGYRGGGDRYYHGGGRHGGGYYRDRHRGNDHDDALAAGVVGLALGAVIGSALSQPRYEPRYAAPPPAYYPPPPAYGYYERGPTKCVARERQYDPYVGREIVIERRIPCY